MRSAWPSWCLGIPERFDAAELIRFCDEKLARYKIPKGAVIAEELPRNAAGKVLKRNLRADHS